MNRKMVGVGAVLAVALVAGVIVATARGSGTFTTYFHTPNKILALASKQHEQVYVAILNGASTNGSKSFSPDNVQIRPGTTVVWRNDDNTPHTVTSRKGMNDTSKGKIFDSGPIGIGKTFSHKFDMVGTYDYFCTLHPTMAGTVTVKS